MDSSRGKLNSHIKTTFLNEEYTLKYATTTATTTATTKNPKHIKHCTKLHYEIFTTKCFHINDLKEFKLDAFKTFVGSDFQSCVYKKE